MKQRRRRKTVKPMATIQVDDPTGFFNEMTPAQRTAYVTRLLRKYIRSQKK